MTSPVEELASMIAKSRWRSAVAFEHGIAAIVDGRFIIDFKGCPDPECGMCSIVACPFVEPLHFHHDGCPACTIEERKRNGVQ